MSTDQGRAVKADPIASHGEAVGGRGRGLTEQEGSENTHTHHEDRAGAVSVTARSSLGVHEADSSQSRCPPPRPLSSRELG